MMNDGHWQGTLIFTVFSLKIRQAALINTNYNERLLADFDL